MNYPFFSFNGEKEVLKWDCTRNLFQKRELLPPKANLCRPKLFIPAMKGGTTNFRDRRWQRWGSNRAQWAFSEVVERLYFPLALGLLEFRVRPRASKTSIPEWNKASNSLHNWRRVDRNRQIDIELLPRMAQSSGPGQTWFPWWITLWNDSLAQLPKGTGKKPSQMNVWSLGVWKALLEWEICGLIELKSKHCHEKNRGYKCLLNGWLLGWFTWHTWYSGRVQWRFGGIRVLC